MLGGKDRLCLLYSPAKKLNMDPVEISVPVTKPRLCDDTKELAIVAKSKPQTISNADAYQR